MSREGLPDYTALIRTCNSQSTLPATLDCLNMLTAPPSAIVIVDSASTDGTLALLPPNAAAIPYRGDAFDYSSAINQGIALVRTPFVLIISSHTALAAEDAVAYGLGVLAADPRYGAAYFTEDRGVLHHHVIDQSNFDGFNGLWNTCSLIRTELVVLRPFRSEVFAAEDQEWARWLIQDRGGAVARIAGAGMSNGANPHAAAHKWRKRRNEYLAVAWYVRPSLRSPRNIAALAYQSVSPFQRRTLGERRHLADLAARMLRMRWGPPTRPPRYY